MAIEITREELYTRVWAEPALSLSRSFGVSDVGLAKACRRHDIPMPGRGYWAKKQAGKRVSQPKLPAHTSSGYGDTVRFPGPNTADRHGTESACEPDPLVLFESDPANAITVVENARIRHPLLRSTLDVWKASRRKDFGWGSRSTPHLNIAVSRDLEARALRILQALFDALAARGHTIDADEQHGIRVTILDETCGLVLRERLQQVRTLRGGSQTKPTVSDNARPHDLVPAGDLEIRVESRWSRRHFWRDCEKHRVEDTLNRVVVALVEAARAEKAHRLAEEQRRKDAAEVERRRIELDRTRRNRQHEQHRFHLLHAAVSRHRALQEFVEDLAKRMEQHDPDSSLGQWIRRAREYVASLDVLKRFQHPKATLLLYFPVMQYEGDSILKNGFADKEPTYNEDKELPACVTLADVPLRYRYGGGSTIVVELPEADALPYEVIEEGASYRTFMMPADIANKFPRRVG